VSPRRPTLRATLVALAVIAVDQVTKALVRGSIAEGETVRVLSFLHLVNTRNTGIAFSRLANGGPLVVIVAVLALVAVLAFFHRHRRRRLVWLPTGLLLGGAAGNLIDRVRAGAVTDFVKLPHWPAFNVADTCITVGVLLLVYVLDRAR
jgi:signal peptidase II